MRSIHHIAAASLIGNYARAIAVCAGTVCIVGLPGSLRGQSFSACGSNICASTGTNVGIGTTSPGAKLTVLSSATMPAQFFSDNYYYVQFVGNQNNSTIGFSLALKDGAGNYQYGYVYGSGGTTPYLTFMSPPNGDLVFGNNSGSGGINQYLTIKSGGNVGIGTTAPQSKLAVNGTITTKEVIVTNTGWADYVFKAGYRLRPLAEVATYVQQNHHLPDIPSEAEVAEKGVGVGEMQAKLLAKIEELTLHMIEADEKNAQLGQQNQRLQERDREIEARIARLERAAR